MADLFMQDRVRKLWIQIDQLHLSYLQTDESLYKLEQREKLEGYIREYLCLVPHDQKFCFRETADVLHRSATTKEDFSGYKAASAWNAIGLYAANLLSQPWRKEYRVMKMYCGFYKHEVEANLLGAELMLEAMGYKNIGNTTMVLEGPIDPDRVSNVSRDSLVAFVECQLLKYIWEQVSSRLHCTWLDVLEYRENHVGSPENATRGMIYRLQERNYQEQQQHLIQQQHQHQQQKQLISASYHHPSSAFETYGTAPHYHSPAAGCLYGSIQPHLSHLGYNYYPHSYTVGNPPSFTLPSQSRYASGMNISQSVPYQIPGPTPVQPTYQVSPVHHPVLKSQDIYPGSSHLHQFVGPMATVQIPPHTLQNGYPTSGQLIDNHPVMPNYGYTVPTGQLIELENSAPSQSCDSQHTYPGPDSAVLIPRVVKQHISEPHPKRSNEKQVDSSRKPLMPLNSQDQYSYLDDIDTIDDRPSLSKAKEDGKGTFDNWNYVFQRLESQGYSKDLGDRPNVLSPEKHSTAHNKTNKDSKLSKHQPIEMSALENTLMALRLDEYEKKISSPPERKPMKINEALHRMKLECDAEGLKSSKKLTVAENTDARSSVYDNMSSPPKEVSYSEANRLNIVASSEVLKNSEKSFPKDSKKNSNKKLIKQDSDSTSVKPHSSKTVRSPDTVEGDSDYYPTVNAAARERPVSVVTETNKSNLNINKNSTKTLPREPKKHNKRSAQTNLQYSSATLDPRRVSDYSNRVHTTSDLYASNETDAKQKYSFRGSSFSETDSEKWECGTCTYLNHPEREVCEMCGKSKIRGSEIKPLASGGRECPKCTLVNEKGVDTCVACECSLKDSPTYI